ncbi:MAG: hypothetical protein P8Y13_12530 [Deinococcales bacterium]
MAALVPAVVAAAGDGDPRAVAVLEWAGEELARLARLVLGRIGEKRVGEAGSADAGSGEAGSGEVGPGEARAGEPRPGSPQRGGAWPVALAGGIAHVGGALERAFRAGLPAGTHAFVVHDEPVATAARLALGKARRPA